MSEKPVTSRTHRSAPYMRWLGITIACVTSAALTLSACNDTDTTELQGGVVNSLGNTESTESTGADSTSGETTSSHAGISPLGNADTTMKTLRPSVPAQLVPVSMSLENNGDFDRLIINLDGSGTPGWFIDYTDKPSQQGSGMTVDVSGDSVLNVNIDGVALPFEVGLEDVELNPIEGTGSIISEVKSLGTFEGRAQFVVGIKGAPAPYSVQVLQDPTRIVIDVRNG